MCSAKGVSGFGLCLGNFYLYVVVLLIGPPEDAFVYVGKMDDHH